MEKENYAAHRVGDLIQTIEQHSEGTAQKAEDFALPPFKDSAKYLGKAHDLGKYQAGFQKRIYGKSNRPCEHAFVGAKLTQDLAQKLPRTGRENFKALSPMFEYCIAGHHAGLQNGSAADDNDTGGTLADALGKVPQDLDERCVSSLAAPDESGLQALTDILISAGNNAEELIERYAFITRYLYSCLVDADFLDTEEFCNGGTVERGQTGDFSAALERVNKVLCSMPTDSAVCAARNNLQNQAFGNSNGAKVNILNMPTGSGKTLCSIKLALQRAVEAEKKRIIYVIPYTSIIEQTAAKFEEIFGDVLPVLQHHHNFTFDAEKQGSENLTEEELQRKARATENWDAPLIVTTNVQFFESIYHNRSSRLRKLHNMAQSVIVFDEAHMMPVEYLQPCLRAVGYLTEYLEAEAIFMSATMPDFSKYLEEFSFGAAHSLITDKSEFSAFSNCEYKKLGCVDDKQLTALAGTFGSSLVIVNSRAVARRLYNSCTGAKKFCLSTYMTPDHRKKVIAEIKESMGREQVAVFSTSLIEAGVDLDFEAVFREMTGLDSILQSAGRCNREGRRQAGFMHIFELEGSKHGGRGLGERVNITRNLLDTFEDITAPECVEEYYRRLYRQNNDEISCGTIYKYGMQLNSIPFRSYAEKFRIVGSDSVNIVIPNESNAEDIRALEFGGRAVYRRLAKCSAAVHYYELEKLLDSGAVVKRGEAYVLTNPEYYDADTGLNPKHEIDYVH